MKKKQVWVLFLILFLAAFFRFYRIYDYATFLGDEGRDALVVKRMIVDKKLTLLGPSTSVGNLYLGPFYYYLMILPLWLAQLDPVGPAMMVAFLGIATVFLLFKLGKEFFNSFTGLAAASLYAISQPIIEHTRFSWNPNPMPFFATMAAYSLFKTIKEKKGFWLPVLGLCLGACLQLHYVSFVLVVTLFFLTFWLKPQVERKWLFFNLGAFLLILSPMFLFELRHQFVISRGLWRFFTEEKKIGFGLFLLLERIAFAWQRLFTHFLASDKKWFGFILTILGTIPFLPLLNKRKENLGLKILAFWWFLGLFGAALYVGDLHDHYLGFLFPVPFLLIALSLEKLFKPKLKFLGVLFLIFLLSINFLNLDSIAGRAPNCQIKRAKLVGESIARDAGDEGRFNLSLISPTMDFRAMNYRYFVELFGAQPEGFENYTEIETLYIITEQEEIPISDVTSWEISSFGQAKTVDQWRFEEFGYKVLKLKKK